MLKLMRDSFQQLKWILIGIVAIFILFIFVDWGIGGLGVHQSAALLEKIQARAARGQ